MDLSRGAIKTSSIYKGHPPSAEGLLRKGVVFQAETGGKIGVASMKWAPPGGCPVVPVSLSREPVSQRSCHAGTRSRSQQSLIDGLARRQGARDPVSRLRPVSTRPHLRRSSPGLHRLPPTIPCLSYILHYIGIAVI